MKYLVAVLFLAASANVVFAQFDVAAIFKAITTSIALSTEYGLSGYNPDLLAEQVVHFSCAKPSDKIFNPVYFDDPDMATKLDLSKRVGFVIHGWTDSGYSRWLQELSQAWVDNHDTNVCGVDWSIYSTVEYTVSAKRNVYLVAKHLARFIKTLNDLHNVAYSNVTLIGHSLGGQISGMTGHYLDGKIGRIIAMDPASPLFTFPINVPLEKQLDKSDAQFVTVVHSNSYLLGVGYSIGHADYYPNGGFTFQPGCFFPFIFGTYDTDIDPIKCSHVRSIRFVHLSMYKNPLCTALKCDTRQDYYAHQCTDTIDTWGVDSAKIEGDFYFWTGAIPTCKNKFWAFE